MDETFWGDPNVFRPERFLSKDGQIVPTERLLTFGIGNVQFLAMPLIKLENIGFSFLISFLNFSGL